MNLEQVQAFMERRDMEAESYRHDVQRMFDELPKEHLLTLRIMFSLFGEENNSRLVSYYEGVVAATIALRYNVCGGCGKNHDDELLKGTEAEGKLIRTDTHLGESIKIGDALPAQEGDTELLTLEQLDQMNTYHLDDVRDEDTGKLLYFMCTLCGLHYVSIEDRMLRAPDACHGCFLKAAHG